MCDQSDRTAGNSGQQLHLRRKVRTGTIGQQTRNRHTNKGMESVPYHVDARDLVGDKFHREQSSTGGNNPPVSQDFKPLRQYDPVRVRQQPERQNRGVDIQSRGETGCDDQGCNRTRRECCHLLGILPNEVAAVIHDPVRRVHVRVAIVLLSRTIKRTATSVEALLRPCR